MYARPTCARERGRFGVGRTDGQTSRQWWKSAGSVAHANCVPDSRGREDGSCPGTSNIWAKTGSDGCKLAQTAETISAVPRIGRLSDQDGRSPGTARHDGQRVAQSLHSPCRCFTLQTRALSWGACQGSSFSRACNCADICDHVLL